MQRSIIDRLGLVDTAPDFDPRASDRSFAMGYTSAEDGRERVPIEHLAANAMAPATGFTSTARDLCLYFSAHCLEDQRILSDDAKRRMQHGWWAPRAQEQYGLGLQLMDIGTRRLIGHSGGYPGHTTRTWCDPKDRLVISVLCNASDAAATPLCNGIFRLLEHLSHPDDIPPSHADGVDLRSFTGHFNTLSGAHDIACFGTRLLAIPTADDAPTEVLGELVAEDPDTALLVRAHDGYTSEGERFHFTRDATGKVLSVHAFSGMTAYPDDEYVRRFLAGGRVRLLKGEAAEAAGHTAGSAGRPSTVDEDRLSGDE